MISRRLFLKLTTAFGASLFVPLRGKTSNTQRVFAQAIPGGTLDPLDIPKYQTPLLIPPAMPRASQIKVAGQTIDYYEIAVRQFQQQILPTGLPTTTVWGYGPKVGAPVIFHAPSLTIEARANVPVRVKWINELVDAAGNYLPHLLPVDPTLHWANPPGGNAGRDMRPMFDVTPGRYTGPVPLVTHVHGSAGVGDESDGYAEAWFLPAANNIPAGYATVGTWYDTFKAKALQKFGGVWQPGSAAFQYPNTQRASTIWYHDHALGMTRLNVYAGPAGFFIIRGGAGDVVLGPGGTPAVLPGPAPQRGDAAGTTYYEIPIAIQDRAFNADGTLFYPDTREFFDGITGPYIPDSDVSPIWNPEFFGNVMMVNGNTWPSQTVEQRRYRFRFLNGCDSRFLILDFSGITGVDVWQIGNEGGFLAAPVNVTAAGNQLLMSPAERADLIVDFTNVPVGEYVLGNVGPDEPFGGGAPGVDFDPADPDTTGQIMQFQVVPAVAPDPTTPPASLQLPAITPLVGGTSRPVALLEELSQSFADAPIAAMLGTVAGDPNTGTGTWTSRMWMDPITENPGIGATEVWEFYNATVDAHPMHIHEVLFQVVNRQAVFVDEANKTFQVVPGSVATPPEPWENGWKDTVIAYPGQVTRVRMKFETEGRFVWHCHIVEHEDNEMMRPYAIDAAASFPRTSVLDNFNRRNGVPGSKWRGYTGSFTIRNNQLQVVSNGAMYWNPASFGPNQEAYFTFKVPGTTSPQQDLVLKLTGGDPNGSQSEMISVAFEAPKGRIRVETRDRTQGWIDRAVVNGVTFAAGDQFGARALSDGLVIVFKNGLEIGRTYVTAGPKPWPAKLVAGGGKIGVWFVGNQAVIDDFGGGSL